LDNEECREERVAVSVERVEEERVEAVVSAVVGRGEGAADWGNETIVGGFGEIWVEFGIGVGVGIDIGVEASFLVVELLVSLAVGFR